MTKRTINNYRFNWRGNNRFQLLWDGDTFYPAMLEAIEHAQYYIALEMYLVDSGEIMTTFIDTLLETAERGVKIFLLFDDFGARGLNKYDRTRLEHENIALHFYNPLHYGRLRRQLFRDHRKLLLVDNKLAYIGGAGISDLFVKGEYPWHDLMLRIEGTCIHDWQTLFRDSWPGNANQLNIIEQLPPPSGDSDSDQLGRVTVSQMSNRQEIQHSLVKRLRTAEHWAWITTAYFVPSWKLRRALRRAARRGVDVRLILPGSHTDHPAVRHAGRRFYYSLLRHGVRIYEFQPRFNHGKAYLCDHWSSIGSSNLDRWNLIWNLEGNQEIEDQAFTGALKHALNDDLKHCIEFKLESWRQRPWHRRLLEWFWGRVDVWLARLSAKLHRSD
ncbi:phosphatidylserine/phosphatidylglycerophosphate/cardiolipin synthase family protein [Pseudomonadota bacterium]